MAVLKAVRRRRRPRIHHGDTEHRRRTEKTPGIFQGLRRLAPREARWGRYEGPDSQTPMEMRGCSAARSLVSTPTPAYGLPTAGVQAGCSVTASVRLRALRVFVVNPLPPSPRSNGPGRFTPSDLARIEMRQTSGDGGGAKMRPCASALFSPVSSCRPCRPRPPTGCASRHPTSSSTANPASVASARSPTSSNGSAKRSRA